MFRDNVAGVVRVWWLLVFSGCLIHHEELRPRPMFFAAKTTQFPSGLRVVFEPAPGSKRVAISVLVGSGGSADAAGKEGTAHFVEHLAFRSRPAGRLTALEELDLAGVAWDGAPTPNAFTGFDTTTFVGVAPTGQALSALTLMSALVTSPLKGVDDATIAVERHVVSNERYDIDPHAGGLVSDAIYRAVVPKGAPASRSLGGTDASLASITRADLEAFVSEHYRPENVIISIVGDLEVNEVAAMLPKVLPIVWLSGSETREPLNVTGAINGQVLNPPLATEREIIESRVSRRRLIVSWLVPGQVQPSGTAMPLVRSAMNSALPKPTGVHRMWTSLSQDVHYSTLSVTLELDDTAVPDQVSEALRKREWFGSFRSNLWARLTEVQLLDEQNVTTRALSRSLALFGTGRPLPLVKGPDQSNIDALNTFSREVLIWDRAREVLVMPLVRRNDTHDEAEPLVDSRQPRLRFDPALLRTVEVADPNTEVRQFKLPSGLNVLLRSREEIPVASVALAFPTGAAASRVDVRLMLDAMLTWQLDHQKWKAGEPQVRIEPDATLVQLAGRSNRVPLMLDVLAHNPSPSVSWYGVDALKDVVKKLSSQPPDQWLPTTSSERMAALVSSVMPIGSFMKTVSLADFNDVSRGAFIDFIDLAFRPTDAWLIVDGDVNLEQTEAVVRELFTEWQVSKAPRRLPQTATLPGRQAKPTVIENQDAAATTLRLACRLPAAKTAREEGANALLAEALSATFERDLRFGRGVTYGVHFTSTTFHREDNVLMLELSLEASHRQAALKRFVQKLSELDGTLWNESDLEVARWHVAKAHLGDSLSSAQLVARLAARAIAEGDTFKADAPPTSLWNTPLSAVDDSWSTCTDSLAFEIEGERSSIEAALKDGAKN